MNCFHLYNIHLQVVVKIYYITTRISPALPSTHPSNIPPQPHISSNTLIGPVHHTPLLPNFQPLPRQIKPTPDYSHTQLYLYKFSHLPCGVGCCCQVVVSALGVIELRHFGCEPSPNRGYQHCNLWTGVHPGD